MLNSLKSMNSLSLETGTSIFSMPSTRTSYSINVRIRRISVVKVSGNFFFQIRRLMGQINISDKVRSIGLIPSHLKTIRFMPPRWLKKKRGGA